MSPSRDDQWTWLLDDFVEFHRQQVYTGDIDPVYRVLDLWAPSMGARRVALLSFLHVAYYDFGSAVRALAQGGSFRVVPVELLSLPCGTERRGHRNRRVLQRHLQALMAIEGRPDGLFGWTVESDSYATLFPRLMSIWGNGRWAAYKSAELLSWSLRTFTDFATAWEPDDMGHAHSSGPRKGLAQLYRGVLPEGNGPAALARLNQLSDDLVEALRRRGAVTASHATVETSLCDFHSMLAGRYYVGHDIHQMHEQWQRAMDSGPSLHEAALLRRAGHVAHSVFRDEWGRPVDKDRRKAYVTKGTLA